jgi:hypothetical protein
MPKGPRGEKRPADVIGAAIMVAKIATGEIDEKPEVRLKNAAAELGRMGGTARSASLSKKRKREIAKAAASARWINHSSKRKESSLRIISSKRPAKK